MLLDYNNWLLYNEGMLDHRDTNLLFHSTPLEHAAKILTDGAIILSNNLVSARDKFQLSDNNLPYFLSLSRTSNPYLLYQPGYSITCMLAFNRHKLATKFKIIPVSYFRRIDKNDRNEYEDRIISRDHVFKNIFKYLDKVIVISSIVEDGEEKVYQLNKWSNFMKTNMNTIITNCELYNIPVEVYPDSISYIKSKNRLSLDIFKSDNITLDTIDTKNFEIPEHMQEFGNKVAAIYLYEPNIDDKKISLFVNEINMECNMLGYSNELLNFDKIKEYLIKVSKFDIRDINSYINYITTYTKPLMFLISYITKDMRRLKIKTLKEYVYYKIELANQEV